ncbi:hypothetical protein PF005_g8978 [Phytophthora fragariae]|uniref:Uncharacterized protein n=1 Tax=Phytophthora fragariae TaxID=53985 RepID=A0A6A3F4Q7_9STRA|nr:hypothetical protein PF003_g3058 [Phytophthora fragariae]KAE8940392.1 hypothetical protein PF009_g9803 [Phytophthora fragariae]KAE9014851.1 hypothetical protein PF011_g7884 [Phytophthora fragariae]KAE9111115.1 hypothetical protein PF010_g10932 [Phytophthora fragariae]KAE9112114.1 hypothetical protein PF007_g11224 [Phytophthora fragariae]
MPRESNRARLIRKHGTPLNARLLRLYARVLHDDEDVEHDQLDDAILSRLANILSSRYVSPRIQEVCKPKFNWFIHEQSGRGFLRSFCMEIGSFHKLVELIQDHEVFACIPGKKKKASVAAHLLVFLKYIGTPGSDACVEQLGETFEVGNGVAFNCIERTTTALLALYRHAVSWPSPSEREELLL